MKKVLIECIKRDDGENIYSGDIFRCYDSYGHYNYDGSMDAPEPYCLVVKKYKVNTKLGEDNIEDVCDENDVLSSNFEFIGNITDKEYVDEKVTIKQIEQC